MTRVRKRRLYDDAGMSMAEVVVASAMFLIILVAVLTALDAGTRAERGQQARQDALVELRQAMTRLTRELRQATAIDPTSTHETLKMETVVSGSTRDITYALVSTGGDTYELRRQVDAGTPRALVTNMVVGTTGNPDPPFCYSFDNTSVPPACIDGGSPPDVLTTIRLTLAKDPEFNPGEPITLATDVELRNL